MMTHRASLMMLDCIPYSCVLIDFFVVLTTNFILSRLSWEYHVRTVHLFAIIWVATITESAPISYAW